MPRLEDDIAAAVDAFGVQNVGLVWGLGTHDWTDEQERDSFLKAAKMSGVNPLG